MKTPAPLVEIAPPGERDLGEDSRNLRGALIILAAYSAPD